MFVRLAELTPSYDAAARRLMPGCPVISEATDVYGRTLGAGARPRRYATNFEREIDRLFLETTLEHLRPIGRSARRAGRACGSGGYRLGIMTNDADANTRAQMQRLGIDDLVEFVAGYDSGFGQKPDAAPGAGFRGGRRRRAHRNRRRRRQPA